jgi:hypothetical protein
LQLKAALAAAVRSRVPEYRKAADDAAKAFFRDGAGSLLVIVRVQTQRPFRAVRTNTMKYAGKCR